MATIVQEYVEKYTLDANGYITGAQRVQKITHDLSDAHDKAIGKAGKLKSALNDTWSNIGVAAGATAAAIAVVLAGGVKGYQDYAQFDALRNALISVEGSATKAEDAISRLRQIAQAPGLGVNQAITGYLQVRNAGADPQFAESLVKELGNAVARGGGGPDALERILAQVSQSLNKPFLQGEELSTISEANVPAYKLLKQRFGTANPEDLKAQGIGSEEALRGLVQELAKLPRVAGSAQNSIDNYKDAVQRFSIAVGAGEAGAGQGLDALGNALGKVADSGVATSAVSAFSDSMGSLLGVITGGQDATDSLTAGLISALAGLQTLGVVLEGYGQVLDNLPDWIKHALFLDEKKGTGPFNTDDKTGVGDIYDNIREALQAQADAPVRKPPPRLGSDPKKDPPSTELPKIALNTERSANATEKLYSQLNNLVLGGGTVGQAGLSLNDLTGLNPKRSGGGSPIRVAVDNLVDAISSEMRKAARNSRPRYADVG